MKKILFTLLCALLAAPAFAGAPDDSTLSVRLYFEGGQHGRLIPSEATTTLKTFFSDTSLNIKNVSITAWASPDGPEERNYRIAASRADTAAALLKTLGLSPSMPVSLSGNGEQWEPIAAFLDTTKDIVLTSYIPRMKSLLVEMPLDRREWMLRQDREGRPWSIVVEAAYPACRYADVDIVFERKEALLPVVETVPEPESTEGPKKVIVAAVTPKILEANRIIDDLHLDTLLNDNYEVKIPAAASREDVLFTDSLDAAPVVAPPAGTFTTKGRVPHYVCALRTNLLMPATNLGLEFHFGRRGRTSLAFDAFGPWMGSSLPDRYRMDIAGAGVEFRYWLRDVNGLDNAMTGLSIGLSGRVAMWDVQWNGPGSQGEGFTVGVDGSWAVKAGHCRFMFTLGLGYCQARWRPYHMYPGDDRLYRLGEWHETLKWLGPVRAGVTLLVPFGKLK